jgi:hypothetical protein
VAKTRTKAVAPDLKERIPEILERMIEGESLRQICTGEGFPSKSTFLRWVTDDVELEKQYRLAVDFRADVYFERMLDIASTQELGETTKTVDGPDGIKIEIAKGDMVNHRKLHIDTIKWALARMNPKKYGDKVDLNHGGRVKVVTLDHDDEAV